MKRFLMAVALCAITGGAIAQTAISGANSNSNANANASTASQAGAASNQAQQANNAGNAQDITFNSAPQPTTVTTKLKTNDPVPLVAGVSFSSDYCGGTASGGASAAGISIGASKPLMDRNCQAIRRAQTFGMLSANAKNMGNLEQANRLMAMSIYEICESGLGSTETFTQDACLSLGLVMLGKLDPAKPLQDVHPTEASPEERAHAKGTISAEQQAGQQSGQPVTIRDEHGREVQVTAQH